MNISHLKKLKELKDEGIISQEEFDKRLSEYIDKPKNKVSKDIFDKIYKFFIISCIALTLVNVSIYIAKKYFNFSLEKVYEHIQLPRITITKAKSHYPTQQIVTASGILQDDVEMYLTNANVPAKFIKIYETIFSNQIKKAVFNDHYSFTIKWLVTKSPSGEIIDIGDMVYASFEDGNKIYKRYFYKGKYYDEQGISHNKSGFIKKPLDNKNGRIFALFGYIKNSILFNRNDTVYRPDGYHYNPEFHKGVDYVAPEGTAVYASGSGIIDKLGYEILPTKTGSITDNATVVIHHDDGYRTAYGCMKKYASNLRFGSKVQKGQIIGYVGKCSDWYSMMYSGDKELINIAKKQPTYLHFELIYLDEHINPLTAKVMEEDDISENDLVYYKEMMRDIDANIIPKTQTTKLTTSHKKTLYPNMISAQKARELYLKEK